MVTAANIGLLKARLIDLCGLFDFANINPDQFSDTVAEEDETEDESNDSRGEVIEEMEYADMVAHKLDFDSVDMGSKLFE